MDVFSQTILQGPVEYQLKLLGESSGGLPVWLENALLYAPVYITGFSLIVILAQLVYDVFFAKAVVVEETAGTTWLRFKKHVASLGGAGILVANAVRLLACLGLLSLTLPTAFWFHHREGEGTGPISNLDVLHDGLSGVFVYASILAFVSVFASTKWSRIASAHTVAVLLAPWALYMYRDVWPLCTFTFTPVDAAEGWVMWAKVALVNIAGTLVPLLSPRQHVPIDPEDIPGEIAPTDTASWLSMMTHSYCDPIVLKANQVPHLKLEDLPPLSDKDSTKTLVNRTYHRLDPQVRKKRRHIVWSLIFWLYPWEHIEMAFMLFLRTFIVFLSPLGINRLLNYIETGGEGAIVRPWVWVLWLLLGPTIGNIGFDWYFYRNSRCITQWQALLTQLVFDHALRMRVKSDAPKVAADSAPATRSATPDSASAPGPSGETGEDSTDAASVATSTTKAQSTQGKTASSTSRDAAKSSNVVGRLTNLVSTDLATLPQGFTYNALIFLYPTMIIMCLIVLHSLLGWSVYPGVAVILMTMPVPGYITKLLRSLQVEKMKQSDSRMQTVSETMNVIRMIKLFGWEHKMADQLSAKRDSELKYVRKLRLYQLFTSVSNYLIPLVTVLATFGTYTLIMKETLTASKVFSAMAIFEIIQEHMTAIFNGIPLVVNAKVAMDRIDDFLNNTELLDEFTEGREQTSSEVLGGPEAEEEVIGIRASSFTWNSGSSGTATPGSARRNFTLRIEDEIFFKRGCVNLIMGQTGSGKTSLLMALLGEMHYTPLGQDSLVSLPRSGGIAYHAQESWVLNETIRDNILFGSPYDERRYKQVIEQCGLKPDLVLWSAGDQTEVGEKGLTLSGGQKARVTLARAVYSPAEILLLDDVLAALDVHTAKWIVDKCFQGELLRGRTVILVTHNIALAAPLADFVVSLSTDGRVLSQGDLSGALAKDKALQAALIKERKAIEKDDQVAALGAPQEEPDANTKKLSGQLVVEEEVALGHMGWSAMTLYADAMRGPETPVVFWTAFLGILITSKVLIQVNMWVLAIWSSQYDTHDPSTVPASHYLGLYSAIIVASFATFAAAYCIWVIGSVRASRRLHQVLIESVLTATLRWLDKTPISRIVTRCTQDIASLDAQFCAATYYVFDITIQLVIKLIAVIIISPIFALPGFVTVIVGCWVGDVYMKAQLPVKREFSNAKAPIMAHFGSAVGGLVSIRAYGAQAAFRAESYRRVDRYTRAQAVYWHLNRWFGVRSGVIAGVFAAALGGYLIYGPDTMDSSTTGFALTMGVGFSSLILWLVRIFNMAEVEGNSVERIQQYLDIEHEPQPTKLGEAPAYWPASGTLRVEGLSARYSKDGPKVLHDLSFDIRSGERIGIVGRTGSGKSSLTLALLRCILTEGKVYYDGLATDSMNLDSLRSNITIIPQVPELLSGTVRQNLDPFAQHDDAELNDALRAAGLFSLQSDGDESRITLDSAISGGGSDLSVGQRQILALARAKMRRSKLLILDEATSAIDYETDNVIQTSLRSKLDKDVTLLTVAHRLQTIMDSDRIMVLDSGRIVEFDKPSELLKNEQGLLYSLVHESGDKEKLYELAEATLHSTN